MSLIVTPVTGGVTSTIVAGAVTGPAISRVIIDSGALPAPLNDSAAYMVSIVGGQLGTVDGNYANMLINIGGNVASNIVSGGNTIGTVSSFPALQSGGSPQRFRVPVQNGQHIYIVAGNTTPGGAAVYAVAATITRLADKYSEF